MATALLIALCLGQVDADPLADLELPIVPIADDAYTMWWMWPWQRIGVRAYIQDVEERADIAGAGVVYHVAHEGPLAVGVGDSSFPAAPPGETPYPTALNAATADAVFRWTPVSFSNGVSIHGNAEAIYHRYVPDIPISRPIVPWKGDRDPDHEALEMIRQAGTRLFPYADMDTIAMSWSDEIGKSGPYFGSLLYRVRPNDKGYAFERQRIDEPHLVRAILFTIPKANIDAWEDARLRIWWDGRDAASVDAPLNLFFGAGSFYEPKGDEYLVKAFPSWIRFDDTTVTLACFWPMPFFESVRFALYHDSPDTIPDPATVRVLYESFEAPPNQLGYFHATYSDNGAVLDTSGSAWSGAYVGTAWQYKDTPGALHYQFDGGHVQRGRDGAWMKENYTLPLAGHFAASRTSYRYHLADMMPFGRGARVEFDAQGGTESVAFWYGIPAPSIIETDSISVTLKGIYANIQPDNHGLLLITDDAKNRAPIEVRLDRNGDAITLYSDNGEYLVPRDLTRGRDRIHLKTQTDRHLRVQVNCFVLPDFHAGSDAPERDKERPPPGRHDIEYFSTPR